MTKKLMEFRRKRMRAAKIYFQLAADRRESGIIDFAEQYEDWAMEWLFERELGWEIEEL